MVMYKPHCGCNLSFSEVERSGYFKCLWLAKLYTSIGREIARAHLGKDRLVHDPTNSSWIEFRVRRRLN